MKVYEDVQKLLRSWRTRIFMMLARGIIKGIEDSSGNLRKIHSSFLANETITGMDQMQEYGFSSHPPPGGECMAAFIGGNRSGGIVIATQDRRYRIELDEGEVAIYTKFGASVKLDKDDKITIHGTDLEAEGDDSALLKQGTGKVEITGGIVVLEGIATAGIKLGAAATLAVAREADAVYTLTGGGGSLVGYVYTAGRVKVVTE